MRIIEQSNISLVSKGTVYPYWTNGNSVIALPVIRNSLTYSFCDVLSRLVSGDIEYLPRYIGFIYGPSNNPANITNPSNREQSWKDMAVNLADISANIQISLLSFKPSIDVDGDPKLYRGNAVIFSAHTRSGVASTYGFPLSSPYAGALVDGYYLYHAVLLSRANNEYIPIARVSLADNGEYFQKPEGFELAVDWQITFL